MTDPRFDRLLAAALEPKNPGPGIRAIGTVFPGVRATGRQMLDYSMEWRRETEGTLAVGGPVLVVLGDSLAQGVGASTRSSGYAALVASTLARSIAHPVGVVNLSRSGARIGDVLETQIPAFLAARDRYRGLRPIGGICTVGSNDLVRSGRVRLAKKRLAALVEQLPEGFVLATVPDRGSLVARHCNRHLRAEADRVGRPVADVAAALTSWRGRLAGDGFHPNDEGHRLWADVVGRAVLAGPLYPGRSTPVAARRR